MRVLIGCEYSGTVLITFEQTLIRLTSPAINAHFTATHDTINPAFGNPFQVTQQIIIQTLPSFFWPDGAPLHGCRWCIGTITRRRDSITR